MAKRPINKDAIPLKGYIICGNELFGLSLITGGDLLVEYKPKKKLVIKHKDVKAFINIIKEYGIWSKYHEVK